MQQLFFQSHVDQFKNQYDADEEKEKHHHIYTFVNNDLHANSGPRTIFKTNMIVDRCLATNVSIKLIFEVLTI